MAAGKNKIETGFRLYFDDSGGTARLISASMIPGTFKGGGAKADEIDLTSPSDSTKQGLGGHKDARVSAQFYMDDTASTGASTVLNGQINGTGTLTAQWGDAGAAPDTGDLEWEGEYVLIDASCSNSGGRGIINALWVPEVGQTAPAWGTV